MPSPNGILIKEIDGGYQPERQILLKECSEDEARRFVDALLVDRKASLRMNKLREEINRSHRKKRVQAKTGTVIAEDDCTEALEHGPKLLKQTRYAWYPQTSGVALATLEPGHDPDDEDEEDYG